MPSKQQTAAQKRTIAHMRERAESLGDGFMMATLEDNGDVTLLIRNGYDGEIMRWRIWRDGGAEIL